MLTGRTPTSAERNWMASAVDVGCIACIVAGRIAPYSVPAAYTAMHHICGKTRPAAHLFTIPLCAGCHQHNPDARHVNKALFVATYGDEMTLLQRTQELVANAQRPHIFAD